jgi:hypothetical protein
MQLKSAASFLMIGSIVLIVHQLAKLFYTFYMGMPFYEGDLLGLALTLLAILAGVVSLVLGAIFRNGKGHTMSRINGGIFLSIVAGLWSMCNAIGTYDYLGWMAFLGKYGIVVMASHILFILACVSLLLMGIALAGRNRQRQRSACVWVIICCGASGLIYLGMSVYTLTKPHGVINSAHLVFMIIELLSVVFPAAWMMVSAALLRRRDAELLDVQAEEF